MSGDESRTANLLSKLAEINKELEAKGTSIQCMKDSTERDLGMSVRSKSVHDNEDRVTRLKAMLDSGLVLAKDIETNLDWTKKENTYIE